MKDLIRKTPEFKDLRAQAREAIAAYEDGADFDFTIARLAAIGEKMNILLQAVLWALLVISGAVI